MTTSLTAIEEFFSQPWGVAGAACVMLAVTCFNSRRLKRRLGALGLGEAATPILFNALNLVGGVCLLVNAVIRREIVWEVLEVYFVVIACKGLLQGRRGRGEAADALEAAAPPH